MNRLKLEKLFHLLRSVYSQRENIDVSEQWHMNVMRRIRMMSFESRESFPLMIGRAAWRLSPLCALLTLICGYVLMNFQFIDDWQLFQLMMNGTEDAGLFEFLN